MRSIVQLESDKCFLCGKAFGSETHHVFGKNPQRRYCEEDGLKIRVCSDCHCKIHNDKDESGPLMMKYRRLAQEKWEAYYGPKLEREGKNPREEFRKRYGKNYLGDKDDEGQLCDADREQGQH